ncbi:MAG: TonB-dependent receptor [Rhodospirillaceae bacterium]|nr:TonB-dependent receptor [Rhodospirillaceae bacterium]
MSASVAGINAARAQTAAAQTAAPQTAQAAPVEEIVVTGSRVISNGYEAPTPVTVMGTAAIEQANQPNIADFVGQLPAFGGDNEGSHSGGNSISTGKQGQSQLNLRSLGLSRTLVLLDGHRFVSSDPNGAVNINYFPTNLINRVDVVTGGASAAYGSDALAGVVNFVLDKQFVGIKGSVSGGVRTSGDDRTSNISLAAGTHFANGRGHLLISAEYANDPGVFDWDNSPWHKTPFHIIANPAYAVVNGVGNGQPAFLARQNTSTILYAPGGIITSNPAGTPGTANALKGIAFDNTGKPFQYQYGSLTNTQYTQGGMFAYSDATQYNQSLTDHLFRDSAFIRVAYDVTDDINVYAQFIHGYTSEWARSKLDDATNIVIKTGNPFIPASVQAQMTALNITQFNMGSFNQDLPPLSSRFYTRAWSTSGGASGKFDAAGTTWNWDIGFEHGFTKTSNNVNVFDTTLFPLAYDAVSGPNGSVICRSQATNPTCVPYNPFGIGVNSQAAVNYVNQTSIQYQNTKEDVQEANVNGKPFESWAGPVAVGVGIAHRYESAYSIVNAIAQASHATAANYKPLIGHYDVTEGYGEIQLPLAKETAWAKTLDFNAAVRATSYSTSGYVTTWKVGAVYQPIDDLRFRVSRSRDIRAPNLADLYAGGSGGQSPGIINPFAGGTTFPTFIGGTYGNPNLKPEVADTTGLGVIVTPTFFPGFSASIDYYQIDIAGAITSVGGQEGINRCFVGQQFYCNQLFSDTKGTVATLADLQAGRLAQQTSLPFNLATQKQQGQDIDITYQTNLSSINDSWDGGVLFHALVAHVTYQKFDDAYNPVQNQAGNNSSTGPVKWRYFLQEVYTNDPLTLTFTERGISHGTYGPFYLACSSNCPTSTANKQTLDGDYIAGEWRYDLGIAYKFMHKDTSVGDAEAFLTIQNVFNTQPVPVASINYWYMSTNPFLYDNFGRVFRAGIRFKM